MMKVFFLCVAVAIALGGAAGVSFGTHLLVGAEIEDAIIPATYFFCGAVTLAVGINRFEAVRQRSGISLLNAFGRVLLMGVGVFFIFDLLSFNLLHTTNMWIIFVQGLGGGFCVWYSGYRVEPLNTYYTHAEDSVPD